MIQNIVDAFTDRVLSGNPESMCIMDEWISEACCPPSVVR